MPLLRFGPPRYDPARFRPLVAHDRVATAKREGANRLAFGKDLRNGILKRAGLSHFRDVELPDHRADGRDLWQRVPRRRQKRAGRSDRGLEHRKAVRAGQIEHWRRLQRGGGRGQHKRAAGRQQLGSPPLAARRQRARRGSSRWRRARGSGQRARWRGQSTGQFRRTQRAAARCGAWRGRCLGRYGHAAGRASA